LPHFAEQVIEPSGVSLFGYVQTAAFYQVSVMGRPFHLNYFGSNGETVADDLSAKYDELLKLRQRVKIAECGRAMAPARMIDFTCDQLRTLKNN
jgi:hypothetical protein